MAVLLKPAWRAMKTFAAMLRQARGSVVPTSSVHAVIGLPGHAAYAAAKGALCSLGRQLAVEYGPDIRVNTVLPGPILTAAWDGIPEPDRERGVAATAARRFGQPEEVAAAVAFLASADACALCGIPSPRCTSFPSAEWTRRPHATTWTGAPSPSGSVHPSWGTRPTVATWTNSRPARPCSAR